MQALTEGINVERGFRAHSHLGKVLSPIDLLHLQNGYLFAQLSIKLANAA